MEAWDLQTYSKCVSFDFLRQRGKKNVLMIKENLLMRESIERTSHPIQATNASPVRNPITAPRSSTLLKFGIVNDDMMIPQIGLSALFLAPSGALIAIPTY